MPQGLNVESYRWKDLDITLDKKGADRYIKASYPVRCGKFDEIKSPDYLFQLDPAGLGITKEIVQ